MSEVHTTAEDVKRLAALARIQVPEAELAGFVKEFESVLAYVGKLDTLSLPHTERQVPELRNVFREDGEPFTPGTWTEKIVEQFPEKEGDSLSVKQIIAHD